MAKKNLVELHDVKVPAPDTTKLKFSDQSQAFKDYYETMMALDRIVVVSVVEDEDELYFASVPNAL